MHLRWWLTVPLTAAMLLALAMPAHASIGVGVQAGPVRLASAAHAGGSYSLPAVYVINTGTQAESIAVWVQRLSHGA